MKPLTTTLAVGAGAAAASYAATVASAWLRYGHPRPARGDEADPLLDRFMPAYDVCERHAIRLATPAEVTLAAARTIDLDRSRLVRTIFRARELVLGASPGEKRPARGLVEDMQAIGWGILADEPGREIILGGATRPWDANPVFHPLPPGDFAGFAGADQVKIAWTLRADPTPDGGSVFRTETRAVATDAAAQRKFRRYWAVFSPGIVLIRAAMLGVLKDAAERRWQLEGDDLVPEARAQLTHATTIEAPPADVWPWLLQMGCQRAGWYSWDRLDNAGVPSADRIRPELQHLQVGDVLPARPEGKEGFEVLRLVPERALVLRSVTPEWNGTWAFVLEPMGSGRTRLVTRYRAAYPPAAKMALLVPVLGAVHAFMERKQLRTIKHHAEHLPAA